LWNERQGWHAPERTESRRSGRPLSYFTRRQLFRDHQIRQERLGREIAFERDLPRTAPPLAWRAARLFRHGLAPQPGLDAPAYMLVGWRLHRRGMYDPRHRCRSGAESHVEISPPKSGIMDAAP